MKSSIKTFYLAIFLILLTSCATLGQNTYYISKNGKISNTGLSPFSPWPYLKEVKPGNTYLFRKGQTFYTTISHVANPENKDIEIGSYGLFGSKPVISAYKILKKNKWENYKKDIWRIDLMDTENFDGFNDVYNNNIGFLKINDDIKGGKCKSITDLNSEWDFFSDNRYLYLFSSTPPNQLNISTTCNYTLVQLSDNMTLRNLTLVGTGGHAVQGVNVKNVLISNLTIKEIGGSYLDGYSSANTRYGNGIEFWNIAANCLVENCDVSDVYDVAFTMQGKGGNTAFNNIIFKNNTAHRNGQSFEFWVSGNGPGFLGCEFINNKCYDAGFGWSYLVRPDKISAVHVLNYVFEVKNAELIIRDNIFGRARNGYSYIKDIKKIPILFSSSHNAIQLNDDQLINVLDSTYTAKMLLDFSENTGLEVKSRKQ